VETFCTAIQATDDNIIRCICIACWITKATDRYSEYVILIAFPKNNGFTKAHQCYVYTSTYTRVCLSSYSYILVELEIFRSSYFNFVELRDCVEHYFGIDSLGYSYLALIQLYCESHKTNAEIF